MSQPGTPHPAGTPPGAAHMESTRAAQPGQCPFNSGRPHHTPPHHPSNTRRPTVGATKHDTTTNTLHSLDFTPSCQHGHPGEMDHPVSTPCENPAEWFSNYHRCEQSPPVAGPGTVMWCSDCLGAKTVHIMNQLRNAARRGGGKLYCTYCKTTLPELKDWIWGTTPIR